MDEDKSASTREWKREFVIGLVNMSYYDWSVDHLVQSGVGAYICFVGALNGLSRDWQRSVGLMVTDAKHCDLLIHD